MQRAEIGRERLQIEGSGDLGFPQQPFGGELRQRGPAGGEGIIVDQRQPFIGLKNEAGLANQTLRKVGHRAQIGQADGAEAANGRHQTTVQSADDQLGELGTNTGRALGKPVHQAHHRRPHHGRRRRRALGNEVTPDQEPAQAPPCRGIKHDTLSLRQSRRQTVDGDIQTQRLLHDLPSCRHPVARRRGQDNLIPPLGDGSKRIDRQ